MSWAAPEWLFFPILSLISCFPVFSRGLKKSSQELYGLICYGELRKKIGGCEYGPAVLPQPC